MHAIARLLSLPLATAYTRLRRARLALASQVAQLQSEPDRPGNASLLLTAEALLDVERRSPTAAPTAVRQRVMTRLRSLPLAGAASPRGAAPGGQVPMALEAGVTMLAALCLMAAAWPPAASDRATTTRLVPRPVSWAEIATAPEASPRRPSALALVKSSAPDAGAGLGRGLTGYWRLDDGPGSSVARDLSGLGNDCVLRNLDPATAWVEGVHGGAVALSGQGWLECDQPEAPSGAGAPAFSIALWVKRQHLQPGSNVALVTREMNPAPEDYLFFGFDGYKLKATGHAFTGRTSSSLPSTVGRWTHVAYTHAADGATRLYLDGLEVAQSQVVPRQQAGGHGPMMVGAGFARYDRRVRQRLRGFLDELLIYGRPLIAEEVAALAAGAQPRLSR